MRQVPHGYRSAINCGPPCRRVLLTSAGVTNAIIRDAMVELLGRPIGDCSGEPCRALQLLLMNLTHVAISVPDLEPAEAYYRALFGMEVVTREALGPDGDRQLPPDRDWDDARRAGIRLYMVALRVGEFVLALFDESSPAGGDLGLAQHRPLFVGLVMPEEDIARVRRRLGDEAWDGDSGGFRDRYGIGWQLSAKRTFVGSGEHSGRWLEVHTFQS